MRQWTWHFSYCWKEKLTEQGVPILLFPQWRDRVCLYVVAEQWRSFMWCVMEVLLFMFPRVINKAVFTLQIDYGGSLVLQVFCFQFTCICGSGLISLSSLHGPRYRLYSVIVAANSPVIELLLSPTVLCSGLYSLSSSNVTSAISCRCMSVW